LDNHWRDAPRWHAAMYAEARPYVEIDSHQSLLTG
jgi:hypothetical protein